MQSSFDRSTSTFSFPRLNTCLAQPYDVQPPFPSCPGKSDSDKLDAWAQGRRVVGPLQKMAFGTLNCES
jgi:hypothetical protein